MSEANIIIGRNSVTEALKAEDPMKWVRLMNLARAEAEHNMMTEIICA